MTGMIDRNSPLFKAYEAYSAFSQPGPDGKYDAYAAFEHAIEAYESAKLAALPADRVERVRLTIESVMEDSLPAHMLYGDAAKAALAALPPVQEVSDSEIMRAIFSRCRYSENTILGITNAICKAGFRIVKGEA